MAGRPCKRLAFVTLTLAFSATLATAQTAPSTTPSGPPALPQSAVTNDTTTVTILAPRPSTAASRQIQLDRHSASSCAFMSGGDRGSPTEYGDSVVAAYMDDFYGPNADTSQQGTFNPADNSTGVPGQQRTFNSNAPSGDASHDSTPSTGLLPGMGNPRGQMTGSSAPGPALDTRSGCTPADARFAAGRAYIASHDTSLRDAYAAFDAKDYAKAMGLFKAAWTKVGYPDAALMIGEMELYGMGGPANTQDAIAWLTKAADFWRGQAPAFDPNQPYTRTPGQEASMLLAKIYLIGWQVPRDANEARRWYAKADDFGYIPATHVMGLVYERGYGVKPDLPRAVSYLTRAGKADYAPSQYELGAIYYNGGDGVAQDKEKAGAWLLLAAKHGYPDALYAVGRMYDLGEGGAKANPQLALAYYKEAAIKGQADAQDAIGLSFYQGQGLARNPATAREWFMHAAESGSADAMFNLAVMDAAGEGGKLDPASAYAWMRLAQKLGLEKAGPAADELARKLTPEERARADRALTGQ